jgi:hypothetical protein
MVRRQAVRSLTVLSSLLPPGYPPGGFFVAQIQTPPDRRSE